MDQYMIQLHARKALETVRTLQQENQDREDPSELLDADLKAVITHLEWILDATEEAS